MSTHNHSKPEGRKTLKLTKWERGNLHLPPVTTVTLYEGKAPVEFLCHRIAMMLENNQATPLQQALSSPGFALVVSMNHTLGDGHTYYKLYSMLSANTDIAVLDPERVVGFEKAKTVFLWAHVLYKSALGVRCNGKKWSSDNN